MFVSGIHEEVRVHVVSAVVLHSLELEGRRGRQVLGLRWLQELPYLQRQEGSIEGESPTHNFDSIMSL